VHGTNTIIINSNSFNTVKYMCNKIKIVIIGYDKSTLMWQRFAFYHYIIAYLHDYIQQLFFIILT